MIDTISKSAPQSQPLREELAQLFALPFIAGKSVTREGTFARLVVTSHRRTDRTRVDLLVSLFPRNLPLPSEEDRDADQAALDAFLEGLNDPDPDLRVGACEALGQLGHPAARSALEAAARDADQSVRVAAGQALRVLTAPRVQRDTLHGLQLRLWRQVRHLRPLREEWTDDHGQAWFANLPANAVYQCQVVAETEAEKGPEKSFIELPPQETRLADAAARAGGKSSAAVSTEALPRFQRVTLAEGNLLCTLYRSESQHVMIEFRSDIASLQNGWVRFAPTAKARETGHVDMPKLLSRLARALQDEDRTAREQAADVIGQIGTAAPVHPGVIPLLVQLARHDEDSGVRGAVRDALERIGPAAAQHAEVVEILQTGIQEKPRDVGFQVAVTKEELVVFVQLRPRKKRGMYSGTFVLSAVLDMSQPYEIQFAAVPTPG